MCYHPNVNVQVTWRVSPLTRATEVKVASWPKVPVDAAFNNPDSCTAENDPDAVNVFCNVVVLVPDECVLVDACVLAKPFVEISPATAV